MSKNVFLNPENTFLFYGEHIIKGKQGRKKLSSNTGYVTENSYRYNG